MPILFHVPVFLTYEYADQFRWIVLFVLITFLRLCFLFNVKLEWLWCDINWHSQNHEDILRCVGLNFHLMCFPVSQEAIRLSSNYIWRSNLVYETGSRAIHSSYVNKNRQPSLQYCKLKNNRKETGSSTLWRNNLVFSLTSPIN